MKSDDGGAGSEGRTAEDGRKRRCPMLGHEVHVSYCRSAGEPGLCRRIADCWWERFDILAFLRACYRPEDLISLTAPPKPKVLSLAELVEKARKNAGKE